MKTLEIIGYKRANLGKKDAKKLRDEALVPGVLYGGTEQIHFYSPIILFRELVYSDNAYIVNLNIEGDEYKAILQDLQFHPVNEILLHVDFLLLDEKKPVKIEVPVRLTGTSPGVIKGGRLAQKLSKVKVKALPGNLPDAITVDISNLDLGDSARVRDIATEKFAILNKGELPIVTIAVTRASRAEEGAPAK